MNLIKEWAKHKDDPNNMFPKATTPEEAVDAIFRHFIPKDFYMMTSSMTNAQFMTEEVSYILMTYESDHFKNLPWYEKICKKIYCFLTGTPLYKFF